MKNDLDLHISTRARIKSSLRQMLIRVLDLAMLFTARDDAVEAITVGLGFVCDFQQWRMKQKKQRATVDECQ